MRIQLSDHFTYRRLLRFVMPPVLMMVCTSLYGIVDGFFVSNYVGKTSFAAVNLIMPVLMGVGSVGFMVGTGGSAVVSVKLGEGKRDTANRYFSMLIYTTLAFSVLLAVFGFVFTPAISAALGAEGELLHDCIIYGRILFASGPVFILQNIFQNFFVTAERPDLSLKVSVAAGVTNMAFDYLLIAVFRQGIAGAALATALGEAVGGIVPVFYFARKNNSLLRLGKALPEWRTIALACANGSSEMVSNLSMSVVNILYNFQLMRMAGEDGVAAYGIIMYVNFVFQAIFLGYAIGCAPVVSYHYGAGNRVELKNLSGKSLVLMCVTGIVMTLLAEFCNAPLVRVFAGYDAALSAMTCQGFRLYALAFLMMGVNIWSSAFFTALNNGVVSAAISFLRTLLFQTAAILLLPLLFGMKGIWLAIVAAELPGLLVSVIFLAWGRKRYRYA